MVDMKQIMCRRHGQTDEAWWWVQDIELGRKSLSAKPICRWLNPGHKKRSRVRKHVDLRRAEKVLSLNHFSWFYSSQAEGKGLRWLTSPELVHQQKGLSLSFISRPQMQSSWPSGCSAWGSSRKRRRKATWTSWTPQSCSRMAVVTVCHQLTEHYMNIFSISH